MTDVPPEIQETIEKILAGQHDLLTEEIAPHLTEEQVHQIGEDRGQHVDHQPGEG
jgi:hypothetical protein